MPRPFIADRSELLPREVAAGPITLDLFFRDGHVDGNWLGFFPREFEVLWRLAQTPGERVSKQTLLRDVWRLDHDPQSNRLEVAISRIRAKLHVFRHADLVRTESSGGYSLRVGG